MKAVVAAFNQEKALVGAFSVLTNLRMELFKALDLHYNQHQPSCSLPVPICNDRCRTLSSPLLSPLPVLVLVLVLGWGAV